MAYAGVPVCLHGTQIALLHRAQGDRGLSAIWPEVARCVDVPAPPEMLRDIDYHSDLMTRDVS